MLCACALEVWYGDCLYHASGGWSLLSCGATIRHRPAEPEVPMAGHKPVQTTV